MKKFRKISALFISAVMIMAMSVTAFAAGDLDDNTNIGGAGTLATAERSVNIEKEIIAYNANGSTVHAPVVTYTYTVTPAAVAANTTVMDEGWDHSSGMAVTVPVQAGLTAGVVVTGTAAGAAGNAAGASGTLEFTNESEWATAADGAVNAYDINLDFSRVTFSQSGVYRYRIAETISANSYDDIAMEAGGTDTLYLDVYVNGSLEIYGYVCMAANGSVTSSTAKINGFVNSEASDGSDKYYTYDLTLSKNVVNDTYGEKTMAYPFTVIFNNKENYTSEFAIDQNTGSGSTGINESAKTLTGLPTEWNGVARVKEGGAVTFTGIPAGVDVDVYETNIANGVTYTVATSVNGGDAHTDDNVSWGEQPDAAVAQTERAAYESTKASVKTEKNTAVEAGQTVAITNTLLLISPTGVVLRVGPYLLIVAIGAALFLISRRRRAEA